MPNCFMLLDKTTGEPVSLQKVDDMMREAFGEPPNEKEWLYRWYDTVGFALAMGRSWDETRKHFEGCENLQRAIDWLEMNFGADAWAERGR